MKFNNVALTLSTALVLAACGATGTQFSKFESPAEGRAKLYVYRPASSFGGGVHYDVKANSQVIGHLRNGGYFDIELLPNTYKLTAETGPANGVSVDLHAGQTQCIKSAIQLGVFVGHPTLTPVDYTTCQSEIVRTRYSHY